MKTPPSTESKTATPEELEALFVEHGFSELLPTCHPIVLEERLCGPGHPLYPDITRKRGIKYRLPGGPTVAVVFYYTHANNTATRHIRMLRVENTRYSAPVLPPVNAPMPVKKRGAY